MDTSLNFSANGQTRYKIVVIGAGAVGKSSLTVRYITDNFLDEYDPTIEDYYRKLVDIDGEGALMDILDTAGQEEFSSMQDEFFRQGKGFIIVYNITSHKTFEHAEILRQKIIRVKEMEAQKGIAIVLAGNKCDLIKAREVTEEEGAKLADKWGCHFYETSAKEKINNCVIFEDCVRAIRALDGKIVPKIKKKSKCVIL